MWYEKRSVNKESYITNLLGAVATTIATRIEQGIDKLGGHSLTHESALVAISQHPNESIDTLSKVLGLTHSGAVRLINTLEKEELVKRVRSKQDARAVVLSVTGKGDKRAKSVLQAREQATKQVLDGLSLEQIQALEPILEAALLGATNSQKDARRICRLCNEQVCRPQGCPVESAVTSLN